MKRGYKVVREYNGEFFSLLDHPAITQQYDIGSPKVAPRKLGPLFVFEDIAHASILAMQRRDYRLFSCSYEPTAWDLPAMCSTPEDGGAMRHFWKLFRKGGLRGLYAGQHNHLFTLHNLLSGTAFAREVTIMEQFGRKDQPYEPPDDFVIFLIEDVAALTGLHISTIELYKSLGKFPAPKRCSTSYNGTVKYGWTASVIREWNNNRLSSWGNRRKPGRPDFTTEEALIVREKTCIEKIERIEHLLELNRQQRWR